jgi:hypothetical protein
MAQCFLSGRETRVFPEQTPVCIDCCELLAAAQTQQKSVSKETRSQDERTQKFRVMQKFIPAL